MAQDFKPHLLIPEDAVEDIPKELTGRGKDYGVVPSEHGKTLSNGLLDILAAFQKLQSSGSISDDDLMIFKVVLQEGEDLASQVKLLEDQGIKINAVKDKNHAVVSTPKETFHSLQGKVDRYRDKGIKKDFQYIAGFEPYNAEEKQAAALLRYYKENPEALNFDIQVMLLPGMSDETMERVQEKVIQKVKESKGSIEDEPYELSDGTKMVRAQVSASGLSIISDLQGVYRIEKTTFFQTVVSSSISPYAKGLQLDPNLDIDSLSSVVILDDGVSFPDGLKDIVPIHWKATGCVHPASFGAHGTPVASKAAFKHVGMHIADTYLTPRAKIIDAQIIDLAKTPVNIVVERIKEAVKEFHSVAKIYNFSYNAETPIDGLEMSILGCELDLLCRKYGVRFVISAGNHRLVFTEDNLDDIIADDDSQISEPADAMLGITVGAVVGVTHSGSVSKENHISPYSRRGPGFRGFYKPDLVAYGATQFKNGVTPSDPYSLCLSPTGFVPLAGTSFTAPTVAGDLAEILSTVPNDDIGLAQALLYNGTIPLYDKDNVKKDEKHILEMAGNLYGRGLSSPENSMYSSENKVSYLHSGTMNRVTKQHVSFHVPSFIADKKVKRGEGKVRVTVTCIVQPPVDRTKGSEYSAAYIRTSIYRNNSKGNLTIDNPLSDNRNKWDTCYHFSGVYSAFEAGSWEVRLELFTRWGVKDDDEIPYSLVITVEDLTESGNMYSEIVKETAGRFAPVQQVRVTVR